MDAVAQEIQKGVDVDQSEKLCLLDRDMTVNESQNRDAGYLSCDFRCAKLVTPISTRLEVDDLRSAIWRCLF